MFFSHGGCLVSDRGRSLGLFTRGAFQLLFGAALLAAPLWACSDSSSANNARTTGSGGTQGGSSSGGAGASSGSNGSGTSGGSGNGNVIVDGGGGGSSQLDPDAACGIGTAEATLKPVSLFLLFDRSNSMASESTIDPETGLNRWETASSALKGFLADPSTDGLGVALRFFPDEEPTPGCVYPTCDVAACSEPLVDIATLSAEPAPTDAHEQTLLDAIVDAAPPSAVDGGTPTGAALQGAVSWAKTHQAEHPDQRTVILVVTDGQPEGCEERLRYLDGYLTDARSVGVSTYFIGLVDADGKNLHEANMNHLAETGGTEQAYFIQDGPTAAADLLETLSAVRGQAIECDFPLPESTSSGESIDPKLVNVTYTAGSGGETDFTKVIAPADCETATSWYYDDEAAPSRIHLCPSACDLVRADPEASFRILAGCISIVK